MPTSARKKKPSGTPRKRKGVKLKPTDLRPKDLRAAELTGAAAELADQIASDGGQVLGSYREPLGGHMQLFAALPIEKVEPTPFQRDVSDAHVRKLTVAMDRIGRFLDPIIAVRSPEEGGKYLTPNGNHRLTALKELDAKSILALVIPDSAIAYKILAMNTEKAHNLREKALEVVRMYGELARLSPSAPETDFTLEFEEPQLVTLGFAYRERPRISGGAYQFALKKVDGFIKKPLSAALAERERRCALVLKLDDAVSEAVAKLKAKGLVSPYLKAFVVARVNPLRFIKGDLPSFDELMDTMTRRASKMDPAKIRSDDLSRTGGVPDEE
jgi:ParB family transcriptional regulator, chromosome partitioning protein